MKIFDNFPEDVICPICKTNANKLCFLIPVDGIERGSTDGEQLIHIDCITEHLDDFRWNREVNAIYIQVDD